MPQRAALCIGINYDDPVSKSKGIPALRFAENDARAMADELKASSYDVVTLLGAKATRDNILEALERQRRKVETGKDDLLLVHFSGHGEIDPGTGAAYLMPVDAAQDDLHVKGISLNALATELGYTRNSITLLDCCHSGSAVGVPGVRGSAQPAQQFLDSASSTLGSNLRRVTLTACAGDKVAHELDELKHGAFTYYALKWWHNGPGDNHLELALCISDGLKKEGLPEMVSGGSLEGTIELRPAPPSTSAPTPPTPTSGTPPLLVPGLDAAPGGGETPPAHAGPAEGSGPARVSRPAHPRLRRWGLLVAGVGAGLLLVVTIVALIAGPFLTTGQLQRTLPHGRGEVTALYSPDGRLIVTGGADGMVKIWDGASGDLKHTLAHGWAVTSVACSPDGRFIVTGGTEGMVKVWNAASGGLERILRPGTQVTAVAYSPDGRFVAAGGAGEVLRIWDTASDYAERTLPHGGAVTSVAYSPDGRFIATGGVDGAFKVWGLPDRFSWGRLPGKSAAVQSLVYSSDGRRLVTAGTDGLALVWDTVGHDVVLRIKHSDPPAAVQSVAYSLDGRFILTGGEDGRATIWHAESGGARLTLQHGTAVRSVNFSPDARFIVTGGSDGTAKIWNGRIPPDWRPW